MKNSLIVLYILLCGTSVFAQRKCGIEAEKAAMIARDPSWAQRFDEQRASLQGIADNYKAQKASSAAERTTSAISPIPVIFHIIIDADQLTQMGGYTGILDRVNSQIGALNRDYNRQNSDSTLIPSGWKPLYGNVGIQFGLAHTQPNGWGTPGYEVEVVSSDGFDEGMYYSYSDAKHAGTGGLDAWDNTKYLNVWCINFADNPGLLGITTARSFTTGGGSGAVPVSEIGVCMNFLALGTQNAAGSLTFPTGGNYTEGRTLTHECGHVFEIWHPWGDDGGLCPWPVSDTTCSGTGGGTGADDGLADTPPEGNNQYGNPAYTIPGGTINDCCMMHGATDTQPIGIACLSFLDYTDDNAMHMFTTDQAAAMASMVLVPPGSATGATGSGIIGESYSLTQNPVLLTWPANTAVTQTNLHNNINIFPNPTTGNVNITFNQNTNSLLEISVTDILGQEVQNIKTAGSQADYYSIDLSGMSKGIYFVRCNFASGSITRKILLQ